MGFASFTAVAALLLSLVSIAMQLVGRDVVATLHFTQAQEIPHLKRQLALCLFLLVPSLAAFAASCVPVSVWFTSMAGDEQPTNVPWWITGWTILGFITLSVVARLFWLCLRIAMSLRDPNTITFTESLLMLWALIWGKDKVVFQTRRGRTGD